jgi:hypothetical protein
MKLMNLSSLKSIGNDGAALEPLGGWRRTQESSIDAATNVLGGIGQVISGSGGRIRGLLRIGQGAFDALDIVPSVIADGVRKVAGTPSNASSSQLNITRSLKHATTDIRTDKPFNTVKDIGTVIVDNVHSIGFKVGSDVLRLLRGAK